MNQLFLAATLSLFSMSVFAGGVNCRPPYCGSPIDCHPCDEGEAPLATEKVQERNFTPVDAKAPSQKSLDLILGELAPELP